MKYIHIKKKRDQATTKVTFNGQESTKYVHIFKDGTEVEFLYTLKDCKFLLLNYLIMSDND